MITRKATILLSIFTVVVFCAATVKYTPKHKNLKVLPQDISDAKLDSFMNSYNVSLGVSCDFCHAKNEKTKELDFASDEEHMKEEARKMMRMTIDINKKNFWYDTLTRPEYLNVVNCYTCHRGDPFPAE